MRRPLNAYVTGRLNASGSVTVKVGPLSAREVWYPRTVTINSTSSVESSCKLYAGERADTTTLLDESVLATSGDTSNAISGRIIKMNEYVWGVWIEGTPNAYVTLTVLGERDI